MPKPLCRFTNPILPGFYPDPSLCRVGEDYYLVTSSFEYFPGLPLFHSRDLIRWRKIGHVLDRNSQLPLERAPSSGGLYAPTLRYHAGRYYVVCTNMGGGGNFIVTATRPEGPWSEPVYIDREGMDPSLFFDVDGSVYYTRDGKGPDFDHPLIYTGRIDVHRGKVKGKLTPSFAGTGGVWPEASHLYRRGRYYYLMIAEGGTGYDHSVVVARSHNPQGAFETCPHNPLICHRNLPRHPIQATGHADLVETQNGDWYAVLLGIRPKGGRYHHLGRETFLVPVTWDEDNWPHFGKIALEMEAPNLPPCPWPKPKAREHFDDKRLALDFVFLRNPPSRSHSLTARPGYLRLWGLESTAEDIAPVTFVGRRQEHFDCAFSVLLDFAPRAMADEAGLLVRGSEAFHYALVVRRASVEDETLREVLLFSVVGGKKALVGKHPLPKGPVVLEVRATPKDYEFAFGQGKQRRVLGTLPTRALSAENISRLGPMCFTGVVVGMYATGRGARAQSPADFDWFEYRPSERA